jgi:hypothetical protein
MPRKKESRKRQQKKRSRRKFLIGLIILIIAVPALWFLSYGLANKPLIEFTFGSAPNIRLSYSLNAMTATRPGTIDIINVLVRNRGFTDISIIVSVYAENALLSSSYAGPYNNLASDAILALANGDVRYVTFYLTLQSQVSSFTIWCDVSKIIDYSTLSSSLATTFAEINPIAPILLVYKQSSLNPDTYQLAQ